MRVRLFSLHPSVRRDDILTISLVIIFPCLFSRARCTHAPSPATTRPFTAKSAKLKEFVKAHAPRSRLLRSEEHTSELQSLMRISYAVFCLKKKNIEIRKENNITLHTK